MLKIKKSYLLLVAVFVLAIVFAGCEAEEAVDPVEDEQTEENGETEMEDGTFKAASEADEHGYAEAEVTISNGNITDVTLWEYTGNGEPKDEDYEYDVWHEASEELPERFVEANSADIDVYTEATGSSKKSKDAVEKAIERASGYEEPFDGTFMGISDKDERGRWGVAWVTLENGNITEVELEEVEEDGEFREEDYDGIEEWSEAYEEMPERFEEANSSEVDVYTGATGTSEKWMEAVERVLENAGK